MKFANLFLLTVSVPAVAATPEALDSRLTAVRNQINSIRQLHLGKTHDLLMNETLSTEMASHCHDPDYWDSGVPLHGHLMLHTNEKKAAWETALKEFYAGERGLPKESEFFPHGLTWTSNAQLPSTDSHGNAPDQWENGVGQWYSEREFFLDNNYDMWYGDLEKIKGKFRSVGHVLNLVDTASTEMACAICSGLLLCNFKYDQNQIDPNRQTQVGSKSRRPEFVSTLTLPPNTLTTDQVVKSIKTLTHDGVPPDTTLFYNKHTTPQEAGPHGVVYSATSA